MRLVCAVAFLVAVTVCPGANAPVALHEIPFQFRDGFIWVEVTVSGCREPVQFLLDSGAQMSVLDQSTAQRLGLKRERQVTVQGVGARTTGFLSQGIDLHAGGVPLARDFLILDLQKLSDACTNGVVEGLIGADFFRDRIVQIDFQNSVLRLMPGQPTEPGTEVLPLKLNRGGMLVPITVNGAACQWVRLDTGCASALHWVSTSAAAPPSRSRLAVALTHLPVSVTSTSVCLGERTFDHLPADVHRQALFPGEKGLLGNGLLSRFKAVTIDAAGGKLFLR